MAKIVGLPKLSPTMEEGTLARWVKKEGDDIAIDDLVAEIDTDKATMEWRAFEKGVLLKILAPEGSTLAPDQPVAIVGQRGEDVAGLVAQAGATPVKPAPMQTSAAPPPKPAQERSSVPPPARPLTSEAPLPAPEPQAQARPSRAPIAMPAHEDGRAEATGRVLASPLVRKLAREQDIDLRRIAGSGPGGRIVKRDLDGVEKGQARSNGADAKPAGAVWARPEPEVVKLSQMRKTIARRLTEAKQTVPHFYLKIDVDAEPLVEARARINADLEKSGEKVSLNDLVIKACAAALRRLPAVNASFAGDHILRHQSIDISVAVAIPDGLLTPVVRDADRKGVLEIAREVKSLAARAREKKLNPEEMTGGTFSISNLGMYGIESFSAVINPPEGAILAVGTVREEAVVRGGAIAPGKRMRMTMSCDHRVVDGALGAEWLAILKRLVESPITLLV